MIEPDSFLVGNTFQCIWVCLLPNLPSQASHWLSFLFSKTYWHTRWTGPQSWSRDRILIFFEMSNFVYSYDFIAHLHSFLHLIRDPLADKRAFLICMHAGRLLLSIGARLTEMKQQLAIDSTRQDRAEFVVVGLCLWQGILTTLRFPWPFQDDLWVLLTRG